MIFCIGSINVDFIFATSRWPSEHEKYRTESYICANGGSAANTAVELSRLGRKVTIVGGTGTDDLGNIALRSLIKAGVNIDHVIRRSDWKTGCAAIRSQGNSKSILTAGGIDDPTVAFKSLQTLDVRRGDHLHFSWAPSQEIHDQLQHWRQMGASLSWETDGRMNVHTAELMDVIFMNETERKMYRHKGVVTDAWINSLKHDVTVVATLGEAGAEAYFRGERLFCKAQQVNVVDRTGGGDAFDAGFLDAWLDRSALDACLERGLRSAAIVLGQIGPQYRSDS
jgi:sugar/nucleoside kinase (ribokinase family)